MGRLPNPDSIAHILLFFGGLALREFYHQLRPSAIVALVRRLISRVVGLYVKWKTEIDQYPHCTRNPAGQLVGPVTCPRCGNTKTLALDSELAYLIQVGSLPVIESKQAPRVPLAQCDPSLLSTLPQRPDTLEVYSLRQYAELAAKLRLQQKGQDSLMVTGDAGLLLVGPQPEAESEHTS